MVSPGSTMGLSAVRQFVDIEHLDAVQLGHFVQIEIVGDDFAVVNLGELDQLHIHLAHLWEILFDNLHR